MKKAAALTLIALLALLCVPFPAGAAERRPKLTHEFAEQLFWECWRKGAYKTLSHYDFTYHEFQVLKELLGDNTDVHPNINNAGGGDGARNAIIMIIENIIGEFKFDRIITAYFIEQIEEESNAYSYYVLKPANGHKEKIYVEYTDVMYDGRMHRPKRGDMLEFYLTKEKEPSWHGQKWKLVKIFYPDDGKPHYTRPMRSKISAPRVTSWEIRQLREKVLRNRVILDPETLPGEQAWPPPSGAEHLFRGDLPAWGKDPRP